MATYAMFLARRAALNLSVAIDHRCWGWTPEVLDATTQRSHGVGNRDRAGALGIGDRVLLATSPPGRSVRRRVDAGQQVVLSRLVEVEVVRSLYSDSSPVWEDAPDPYSERFDFRVLSELNDIDITEGHDGLLRSLVDSMNRAATPFAIGVSDVPRSIGDTSGPIVDPPPRTRPPTDSEMEERLMGVFRDYEVEARRKAEIGGRGEVFVFDLEVRRLEEAGRPDLAQRVERVSVTRGDGLGYDILSFDERGNEIHIEVKTTIGPVTQPFPISAVEADHSARHPDRFQLHRVFDLDGNPGCYVLTGELTSQLHMTPTEYLARR